MRRWTPALLIGGLIAASPVLVPSLHAQDEDESMTEAQEQGMGAGKETHVQGRHEEWTKKLGLSDEQAKQLREAFKAHRESMKGTFEKLKKERQALKALVDDPKSKADDINAAAKTLREDFKQAMEARRSALEEAIGKITPTLTDRQKAVLQALPMLRPMHGVRGAPGGRVGKGND